MKEGLFMGKVVTTISHNCTQCGECCRNRYDMYLMPIDVFRIAKHFKMTCENVINSFCERVGSFEVKARTVGNDDRCIFLRTSVNGGTSCAIYDVRPLKCYIYPLGANVDCLDCFSIDEQCNALRNEKQMSALEFAIKMSNNRYKMDWLFRNAFVGALENLERRGTDNNHFFEYLFYNDSEEEVISKITELNV